MGKYPAHRRNSALRGFSLVELSVVLIILGLLVGGILGGRSLIKAAELRVVIREAEEYRLALNNFLLRYDQLPGDFDQATDFFGVAHADPDTCKSMDKSNMAGTCNGNGDGAVGGQSIALRPEHYLFWHHLQKAGLIGGADYTGARWPDCSGGSGCTDAHKPGLNCPASAKGSDIGWSVYFKDISDGTEGNPNWFEGIYGHIFTFGALHPAGAAPNRPALTVAEVWNIDTKMDDGLPAQGKIVTRTGEYPGLALCTETSPGSGAVARHDDLDAVYRLSQSEGIHCNMIMRKLLQ